MPREISRVEDKSKHYTVLFTTVFHGSGKKLKQYFVFIQVEGGKILNYCNKQSYREGLNITKDY